MMKKIIFVVMLSVVLYGCKKIDGPDHATLTTKDAIKTSLDLENILAGAYSALASDNAAPGYWKVFPELMADHVNINLVENIATDPYPQLLDRNMVMAQYPQCWDLAYTAIQNANIIIYAIDNNLITRRNDPTFNDAKKGEIKGGAHFIRAFAYFELIRFYGHQYGYNSTASNSGVILRTKPAFNVTKPEDIIGQGRATVEEVYQLIISDFKTAELILPPSLDRRGRATTFAASAILARVYFQMNDYPNTLAQISKVIGDVPGTIQQFPLVRTAGVRAAAAAATNVLAPFTNTGATANAPSETIFDFISATNTPVNGAISRKYLKSAIIDPHLNISDKFWTDAAFTANDQRGTPAGLISRYNGSVVSTTAGKRYSKKFDRALENIPIIRSAELILDRAEINAMNALADPQAHADAILDLNVIRDRAIAPNYVPATTLTITAANILAEVRLERLRELAFEGDRLHSLRRMGAIGAITDIPNGDRTAAPVFPWNSNRLLFKIPDAEIRTSTNIVQNPD